MINKNWISYVRCNVSSFSNAFELARFFLRKLYSSLPTSVCCQIKKIEVLEKKNSNSYLVNVTECTNVK